MSSFSAYELENGLWKSLREVYLQSELDIDQAKVDMSSFLIQLEKLKNESPQAYLDLLKQDRVTHYSEHIDSLRNQLISFSMALELFYMQAWSKDSNQVKQSKLYQLKQALKGRTEIGPSDFQEVFRKELNAIDCNQSFYQFAVMMVMFNLNPFNAEADVMSAITPQESDVSTKDILSITLDHRDSLFCNGRPVSRENLLITARNHLKEKESKAILIILYDPESTYSYYMALFEDLKNVNEKLRNDMAMALYNKSFKTLSAVEQDQIRKIYPFIVSEIEKTED
ncbi:hypothetical protein GYB29_10750 [bacterium]|nr:hypothetical protein [bacterium]